MQDIEFNQSLKNTIENKIHVKNDYDIRIDKNKIFETYLDIENKYLTNFNHILFSSLKFKLIFIKPEKLIKYLLQRIINKIACQFQT